MTEPAATSPATPVPVQPPPAHRQGLVAWGVWLSLTLMLGLPFLRQPQDPDIFFQLLAGSQVLDHGRVPHQEFFLYAGSQAPQVFGGWGFGLLHEAGVRLLGMPSLSLLNGAMWASVFLMGLAAVRARQGMAVRARFSWQEIAGLLLAAVLVAQAFFPRSVMRAEVTLYMAWMASVWAFEVSRRRPRAVLHLWLTPLLAWVLAWLHTGGFVMLALPVLFAAQRVADLGWSRFRATEGWAHLASGAAVALLPVLNPNGGFQVYAHALGLWAGLAGQAGPTGPVIMEYLPLWHPVAADQWLPAGLLALGLLVTAAVTQARRWPDVLLMLLALALSLAHVRGLGLVAMVTLVPLGASLCAWLNRPGSGPGLAVGLPVAGCLAMASGLALLAGGCGHPSWGVQRDGADYQGREIMSALAKDSPQGGRVFANELYAAELVYRLGPGFKVPHAGHLLLPNPESEQHFVRVQRGDPGWREDLDRHQVSHVIMRSVWDGAVMPQADALSSDPHWVILAGSGPDLLYKRLPPGRGLDPASAKAQRWNFLRHVLQLAQLSQDGALARWALTRLAALQKPQGGQS